MDFSDFDSIYHAVSGTLLRWGLDLLGAVAILVAGWTVAGWAARAVRRAFDRMPKVDGTLKPLLASIARYGILLVTVMAVLARFGVQTTSIVAVLGAAGLAVGLALQGTLANVAAGAMLLFLRPFRVEDYVEVGGREGTVLQIGLFTTDLVTPDNLFVSLPNSSVWGNAIVNFTRMPSRRVDLTVGIDYGDDVDRALAVAMEVLKADPRVLADPPPQVAVRALGESSVDLVVRGFVRTADYWDARFDLQRLIKRRFDAEGITIPFPQRVLHLPAPTTGETGGSLPPVAVR